MTRPSVSVVVPFAGDPSAGLQALELLWALETRDGDQLILSDNSGTVSAPPPGAVQVTVIRAGGERSPAHARNAGAAHASGDFILFLDADTRVPADLLDRYFELPVGDRVGALAGEIRPASAAGGSLATRYAARRNFLSQRAHLAHPFRPRAAAANLLVRRSAFEAAGGFREGLRAAEDTDFSWRLQALGWTLELRENAAVEHVYRPTIRELRAQWRGYAAGRAWLARNHPGFHPEPAARRVLRRAGGAPVGAGLRAGPNAAGVAQGRLERAEFLALDALLAIEELIGLRLGNDPVAASQPAVSADRVPARERTGQIRVDLVDPSAYTPPYDHALASALARAGAGVRLVTSEFAYGSVPQPDGYTVLRRFYRHAAGAPGSRLRLLTKLLEHGPDMLGYRRLARGADVVHFQWMAVPALDRFLLPRGPVVLSAHDLLPREPRPGQLRAQRALYERVDAVVVHSEHGRRTLVEGLRVDPAKVHVIHHGAFEHLTRQTREDPLPAELQAVQGPVVLFFGLLRPYKGIEVLLDAWRGVAAGELWIVGLPRMDITALRARAPERVRFVARFVSDAELPAFFRRAEIVALPYTSTERQDQSGVLATALAFGRPIVLSDVGGFAEVAGTGAASLVAPGDSESLRSELQRLIADPSERQRLAAAARSAADGLYSWDAAAKATLALYETLCDNPAGMTALAIVFWVSVGLLVYTQIGYGLLLAALAGIRPGRRPAPGASEPSPLPPLPGASVIVAAYAEQEVIAARIENLRALDYPPDALELIVACDGSPDETAQRARAAGADLVLELPRGGKVRAQDAAVRRANGQILAFTDANASWAPDALTRLVEAFADLRVGYVCGDVRFLNDRGTNQEGIYWRYEMVLRTLESRLRSVTGGNGAIYATRRESYFEVDPIMGHDLSFPFNMVKRGWLAVYAPDARAVEKMVPSIEGEFARKRRMMSHGWPIVLRGGMLSPRGYGPLYALMIFSHRILRYASPLLHLTALVASIALLGDGLIYAVAVALQVAVVLAALLAPLVPARPLLLARYYVLTTASLAAGLWDWLAHGTEAGWEPAEGTR